MSKENGTVQNENRAIRQGRAVTDATAFWTAVRDRDAGFDGVFVYGVNSTGIYCRPSCPSRRPNPEKVTYFTSTVEAERSGFRACFRCRPKKVLPPTAEIVRRLCREIEASPDGDWSVESLAAEVNVSEYAVRQLFKQAAGLTPREYADACRLKTFKKEVRDGRSVTDALYEAGYGSSSRLYERAETQLGMTPAAYRRKGKGMRIAYATTDCTLGRLLVAATETGVCAVCLGDSDADLERELLAEYGAAEIRRDEGPLAEWMDAVLLHANGTKGARDIPLDIQATAFQRRVWKALQNIPFGETRSYGEIAAELGMPTAARAVAGACASNRAALVVPCHRVIRENGDLGGYRWGIDRKKAILEAEGRKNVMSDE